MARDSANPCCSAPALSSIPGGLEARSAGRVIHLPTSFPSSRRRSISLDHQCTCCKRATWRASANSSITSTSSAESTTTSSTNRTASSSAWTTTSGGGVSKQRIECTLTAFRNLFAAHADLSSHRRRGIGVQRQYRDAPSCTVFIYLKEGDPSLEGGLSFRKLLETFQKQNWLGEMPLLSASMSCADLRRRSSWARIGKHASDCLFSPLARGTTVARAGSRRGCSEVFQGLSIELKQESISYCSQVRRRTFAN